VDRLYIACCKRLPPHGEGNPAIYTADSFHLTFYAIILTDSEYSLSLSLILSLSLPNFSLDLPFFLLWSICWSKKCWSDPWELTEGNLGIMRTYSIPGHYALEVWRFVSEVLCLINYCRFRQCYCFWGHLSLLLQFKARNLPTRIRGYFLSWENFLNF